MLSTILRSAPLLQTQLLQTVGFAMPGRPSSIVTLLASDDEMQDVAALHAETFAHGWSVDEITRLSRRPGATVWLAREEGRGRDRPLGFLILSQIADEAEIISVGVAHKARRRGVGDALVRHAVREAQAGRAKQLFLEVDETNAAAVALYRRAGFAQIGERTAYYPKAGAEPSRALVMSLPLR